MRLLIVDLTPAVSGAGGTVRATGPRGGPIDPR
jgi:hypothetical protein